MTKKVSLFLILSAVTLGTSLSAQAVEPKDFEGDYRLVASDSANCPALMDARIYHDSLIFRAHETGLVMGALPVNLLNQGVQHYEDSHFFTSSSDDIQVFSRANRIVHERKNTQFSNVPFKHRTDQFIFREEAVLNTDGVTYYKTNERRQPLHRADIAGFFCQYVRR